VVARKLGEEFITHYLPIKTIITLYELVTCHRTNM